MAKDPEEWLKQSDNDKMIDGIMKKSREVLKWLKKQY